MVGKVEKSRPKETNRKPAGPAGKNTASETRQHMVTPHHPPPWRDTGMAMACTGSVGRASLSLIWQRMGAEKVFCLHGRKR